MGKTPSGTANKASAKPDKGTAKSSSKSPSTPQEPLMHQPTPKRNQTILQRLASFLPSVSSPFRKSTPNTTRPKSAPVNIGRPNRSSIPDISENEPLIHPPHIEIPMLTEQSCPYDPDVYFSFPEYQGHRPCGIFSALCSRRASADAAVNTRASGASSARSGTHSRGSDNLNPGSHCSHCGRTSPGVWANNPYGAPPNTPTRGTGPALLVVLESDSNKSSSRGTVKQGGSGNKGVSIGYSAFGLGMPSISPGRPPTRHGPIEGEAPRVSFDTPRGRENRPLLHGHHSSTSSTGQNKRHSTSSQSHRSSVSSSHGYLSPTSSPHGHRSPASPGSTPTSPKLHYIHGLPHSEKYPYIHKRDAEKYSNGALPPLPNPPPQRPSASVSPTGHDYSDTVYYPPYRSYAPPLSPEPPSSADKDKGKGKSKQTIHETLSDRRQSGSSASTIVRHASDGRPLSPGRSVSPTTKVTEEHVEGEVASNRPGIERMETELSSTTTGSSRVGGLRLELRGGGR